MSLNTFTPPFNPSNTSQKKINTKILRSDFSYGYNQRTVDGINATKETCTLQWNMLTLAQAQSIEQFFIQQLWYLAFYYQLPDETVIRKWITTQNSYKLSYDEGAGYYNIEVGFEEVFDTGT